MAGCYSRFLHYRKRILACFVSLNVLLLCGWLYVTTHVHEQTPAIKTSASYDQKKDELIATSPFRLREVTASDVKHLQHKFFTSLARLSKRSQRKKPLTVKQALAYSLYNQSLLNKVNQFKMTRDEPARQNIMVASHNGLLQFLEDASCKPISPDVVLYNRIFKTGSETTGALFQFAATLMSYKYSKQTTEDFYDEGIAEPYPMIIEQKVKDAKYRQVLFNAHFYFRNDLKLHRTHTYINQVRDPATRYISHYIYMRSANRPLDRVRQMIESGEINDTIEQCFEKQGQGCKYNVMTRFFCGTEHFCKSDAQKALVRAKEHIVNHYAAIGLLEHFHLTLKLLQRRLPYFFPVVPGDPSDMKVNEGVSRNQSYVVSDEMMDKIKRANWADIELYEFVKQIFWRQIQACGISY